MSLQEPSEIYSLCIAIRNNLLATTGEIASYSWSDSFSKQRLVRIGKKYLYLLDITKLSLEEAEDLGFAKWELPNKGTLLLIPIWLARFADPSTNVTSISGEVTSLLLADTDNRAGLLAYGIFIKEQK